MNNIDISDMSVSPPSETDGLLCCFSCSLWKVPCFSVNICIMSYFLSLRCKWIPSAEMMGHLNVIDSRQPCEDIIPSSITSLRWICQKGWADFESQTNQTAGHLVTLTHTHTLSWMSVVNCVVFTEHMKLNCRSSCKQCDCTVCYSVCYSDRMYSWYLSVYVNKVSEDEDDKSVCFIWWHVTENWIYTWNWVSCLTCSWVTTWINSV